MIVSRMPSRDSRSDHTSRMHREIETINRQLDQALDLETLACGVAHFSPFLSAVSSRPGWAKTLGSYLCRRGEVAATRLAPCIVSVTAIDSPLPRSPV